MEKHLLDPARLRKIPPQFSWIDQRLVREHHIERLSHAAAALYLFLLTVADASGLSFYSERSIGRYLAMTAKRLDYARKELLRAELIAYQNPLYQVLSLDGPLLSAIPQPSPAAPWSQATSYLNPRYLSADPRS